MFATVIDKQGYKIDFVHVFDNGEIDSYTLKDGERIIEKGWKTSNSFLKAKWDFEAQEWIEGATEEEIEAWKEDNKIDICLEIKSNQELTEEVETLQKIIADLEIAQL